MERDSLIQAYLQKKLTPKQEQEFDQMMASDQSFKAEVNMLKDLQAADQVEQLSYYKTTFQKSEARISRRKSQKLIAIVFAFLIAGVLILYLLRQGQKENNLYAKYFQTPQNSYYPILRDANDSSLPIYRAFLAYEKGEFETANKELEILDEYTKTPELQFYNAISLLELEEFDKAQKILNQISTNDPELAQDISWYSALILLRINKLDEAKKILQKTSLSPSRKQLLDEL